MSLLSELENKGETTSIYKHGVPKGAGAAAAEPRLRLMMVCGREPRVARCSQSFWDAGEARLTMPQETPPNA